MLKRFTISGSTLRIRSNDEKKIIADYLKKHVWTLIESKNFKGNLPDADFWDYPVVQPFKISNRKGLLTHPAWLIAHSSNFHTDPIKRGRWIREKLLAGQVPDVPITVDAQVPEDPHKTLRERVEFVTRKAECSKCHIRMNPLGFPFESFDDFGRYRLCLLYTSPSPRDRTRSRMPSSAGK